MQLCYVFCAVVLRVLCVRCSPWDTPWSQTFFQTGEKIPRKCVNSADNVRYLRGEIKFASRKRALTPVIKGTYFLYFGCKVDDQDKSWAPHVCCTSCSSKLNDWVNRKGCSMPFAMPMIWRELTNHLTDCYFCFMPPIYTGITKNKHWTVECPNTPSAIRSVPHCERLTIPELPESFSLDWDEEEENTTVETPQPSTSKDLDFF